MVKALAKHLDKEEAHIAHRVMGAWTPTETSFENLLVEEDRGDDLSKPYPFCLAYPLMDEPEDLGSVSEWQIEHKWDGIRGQFIKRKGEVFVWSRGEELVTHQFPEFTEMAHAIQADCVIDGEIIAHDDEKPLTFNHLQKRLGRKNVGKKVLADSPVKLIAYDLLELEGEDLRNEEMHVRRSKLEEIVSETSSPTLLISKNLQPQSWEEAASLRENSRSLMAEGLMLKRKDSTYQVGRKRGDWWKWKVDPMSIDAVMIYAMRGHGRRANLYTDYTFGVWEGEKLVPFAKAYSGLTDAEIREVDRFVKKNTIDRFGPVRSVKAELVFEIGFEGIAPSSRHQSGIALRFPRILRWRKDKPLEEANTLEDLKELLNTYTNS
jgi:DNA ligase-1